jgi:hypothetical protein
MTKESIDEPARRLQLQSSCTSHLRTLDISSKLPAFVSDVPEAQSSSPKLASNGFDAHLATASSFKIRTVVYSSNGSAMQASNMHSKHGFHRRRTADRAGL